MVTLGCRADVSPSRWKEFFSLLTSVRVTVGDICCLQFLVTEILLKSVSSAKTSREKSARVVAQCNTIVELV